MLLSSISNLQCKLVSKVSIFDKNSNFQHFLGGKVSVRALLNFYARIKVKVVLFHIYNKFWYPTQCNSQNRFYIPMEPPNYIVNNFSYIVERFIILKVTDRFVNFQEMIFSLVFEVLVSGIPTPCIVLLISQLPYIVRKCTYT